MKQRKKKQKRIAFFGHFDSTNFGNESTLQAILHHLRRFYPDAEVTCFCTGPEATFAAYHIEAIPLVETFVKSWVPRNPLGRTLRKVGIGLLGEPYRWLRILAQLTRKDMLIIPGTGLLTDAYGLLSWGWGPYNLLIWSLMAKACRCKLLFVSVGAGPLYGIVGKCFVRAILSVADFRSYRDNSTLQYLESIGFHAKNDRIYPDLAFSLPETVIPHQSTRRSGRSVVGLGVMQFAGSYGAASDTTYLSYLESLVVFTEWLLARECDVQLLSGDFGDTHARQEFRNLLRERLSECDNDHIIDEPVRSVKELLSQIAATDVIVATRFHNVVLALLCNKPVIAVSFHHKCESLMNSMGLSEYCLDISDLKSGRLIEKFCNLEINASRIRPLIRKMTSEFREALDEQYKLIFNDV